MEGLDGPLVWVDCEFTGLGGPGGVGDDKLLEVACIITDGGLEKVIEGPDLVIHHDDTVLDSMSDWCKEQFGWKDGEAEPGKLAEQVRNSTVTLEEADSQLAEFVRANIPAKEGVLAGNSVHMDKRFLEKFTPAFTELLHYRIVDVSTVKELTRRWFPSEFQKAPQKKGAHRALDDIKDSIEELRYYRRSVFRGAPAPKASWQRHTVGGDSAAGGMFKVGGGVMSQSQESAAAKAANLGTVDRKSLAVGGAGSGGGLGLNAPGFGPKVKHFAGGGGGKKSIEVSPDVIATWQQVMDDNSDLGWIFCEYSADGKGLNLKSSGPGGLKDLKEQLGEQIGWGGFRCWGVDRRGQVDCRRPKFVFVLYKPDSASAIRKAKQGSHKGDVKEAISSCHLDVMVESLADLEEESLITKLQAATGAHKPNGYMFEEGVFMEADFYGLGIGKDCKGESAKN